MSSSGGLASGKRGNKGQRYVCSNSVACLNIVVPLPGKKVTAMQSETEPLCGTKCLISTKLNELNLTSSLDKRHNWEPRAGLLLQLTFVIV